MKNELLKKILPHIIALLIFLVVSVLFCLPVLQGNVLNQQDTIGWKGAAENAFQYKERTGHFPLWNPNLFGGMPNYQIAMHGKGVMPDMIKIFTLGLPKPINFFFLACVCFYLLSIALRVRPVVGILTAIAYAFSTYNSVVINAGHDTQMQAMALVPLFLAGLIFTYEKKYWLGLSLTTFGAFQLVGANHLQISYYAFIIAVFITLGYLVSWIKNKDWKHIGIAAAITIISGLLGIAGNALILKTTSEYAKFTMRGGKDIHIEGDSVSTTKTAGLDTSYAFEYSLGIAETFTLMMPNSFGGHSGKVLGDNSKVVDKLIDKGVPENNAIQFANQLPKYWGSLPYTAGPAYLGVLIFVLGMIGFVIVKTPLRWALLAATLFGIMISWGKNFAAFNTFLFEYLPVYNKFRAPSMAQSIPQITMGMVAAIALHQLLFRDKSREILKTEFKKILYAVGGLFGLLALIWLTMSYNAPVDQLIADNLNQSQGNFEITDQVMAGMRADRKAMFGGQLMRAAGFTIILLGALWLYMRNTLKPFVVAVILLVISTLELTIASKTYLSDEEYVSPDDFTSVNFAQTPIDTEILKDKDPNYRVFNRAGNTFNETRTSNYHKSIGGYHPAKLRIYQDVIEKYLGSQQLNPEVVNMLNTKYIIMQHPENGQPFVMPNPQAYGNCWFVKYVRPVENKAVAIVDIGNTNLRDTAIIEKEFIGKVVQPQPDSLSTIRMTKFDNDVIEYEANCNGPQFAVFSEIYYPKGWNAYLDGKLTDYVNVNYILRGMSIPTGKHTIRFVFEPKSYSSGVSIMYISSFLILIVFLGGLFMAWRESRKKAA